ncbi:EAL domain-containing protein [Jiella sp. MQZ9-1]|nr:EAL domain-containing protein [Jiella flava]MCD2471660.1 EAL domain-containing protein [Jiella flava]
MDQFELKRLTEEHNAALALSRTTSDAILHVALPGTITYANSAAKRIIGWNEHELFRKPLAELLPASLVKRIAAAARRFEKWPQRHTALSTVETRIRNACGRDVPIEFSAGFWTTDDVIHMGAIIRDVSERKRREASFQMLFEQSPVPMWIIDTGNLRFLATNDAVCELYGYSREEMLARSVLDVRLPEERQQAARILTSVQESYEPTTPWTHVKADGARIRVLTFARRIQYKGRLAIVVAVIDVTESERAANELKSTQIFLDAIIENIPSMLLVKTVKDGRIVLLNRAGERFLDQDRDAVIGKQTSELLPFAEIEKYLEADRRVQSGSRAVVVENHKISLPRGSRILRTQKVPVPDSNGDPLYILGVSEDVTERIEIEERNRYLSRHDVLTELPNRFAFQDLLDLELSIDADRSPGFSLHLLDLDRFKAINDSFGHLAGDALLRQVANRLLDIKGPNDIVARLGGDEFAIIGRSCASRDAIEHFATAVTASLSKPFDIDEQEVTVGCSIGIAFHPQDGREADALLKHADLALYAAKANGVGGFVLFDPKMEEKADRERRLRRDLIHALERHQLDVVYQPIVDARSKRPVDCEALLRWHHPELGPISPVEFIPIAESINLIGSIGCWVLRRACETAATWPRHVKVAVNLSVRQFARPNLITEVKRGLADSGLSADRLVLEITESVLLGDTEENLAVLKRLKDLGAHIALDDFGTGYSSLSYLQKFHFDRIKIDKSFITELDHSTNSLSIIRAIISLGKTFNADITAEGVETDSQYQILKREHCDHCQGYYFSKPIDAKTVGAWLAASEAKSDASV